MKVRTALLELFKRSHEWRGFFRSCSEASTFRLRSQAWQFRDELKDQGDAFQAVEVEDSLLGLARVSCPILRPHSGTPSGRTRCLRAPSTAWPRLTPGSPPKRKTLSTSRPKRCGMSGCTPQVRITIRLPSGQRYVAGSEPGLMPYTVCELEEERHEFFKCY